MGLLRDAAHLAIAGIQRRATLSRLQLAESKLHLKLRESAFDVMDSVVSQADEFEGWAIADDEGFWRKSNAGFTLTQMRQTMRQMVWSSGIATGAIEAVADYVIGTGFTYEWTIPKEVTEAERALLEPLRIEANRLWKKFSDDNAWPELEAQLCEIADRDGESFLRMFVGQNGEVAVRYVDASDVGPDGEGKYPTGVITMDDDAQAVVGYLISQEPVAACDVIHIALNIDPDLHRGVPTLWPVRNAIVRGEKILKAVGKLAEIQAAISLIRKHNYPTPPAEMASFLDAQADKTPTNVFTGKPLRQKMLPPGAILDIGAADELIFPTGGSTLDKFPPALLSVLRPIAVRLGLPDFVVTGDVSAANFASVFTSMAPSSKRLGRKQTKFLNHFRALHCRVRDAAIAANTLDPLASLLVSSITGPEVSNRDEAAQTNKREVLARNKVLSIKTWRAEEGYDNDEEQSNIEEEAAQNGGFTNPLDPTMPQFDAQGNPIDPSKPPKGVTPPGLAASAKAAANAPPATSGGSGG